MDINRFFEGKKVSKIRVGQSGADVYELDGNSILKHIKRDALEGDLFDTYSKEALFYKSKQGKNYLPEVLDNEISENEIIIVLKKYTPILRDELSNDLIRKITKVLALIHTDDIPAFLGNSDQKKELLSSERVNYCLKGWKSVLNEHPGAFDEAYIDIIVSKINEIIDWHNTEERILTHGDFHFENLLKDSTGNILVCDWQNAGIGGASEDLSFFMSRLGADGVVFDSDFILESYADAIKDIKGVSIDINAIKKHMAAANVITSFEFWHEFLHENDEVRVRGVFDKMASDFEILE